MHLTGVMGSDLIKGALDQRFILECMKSMTEKRQSVLACIAQDNLGLNQIVSELSQLAASV